MKTVQKQSLIEYLDALVAEGKEISMGWEGGGDSGWAWFHIDDQRLDEDSDNVYIRTLLDHMYNMLDYGSWAGEFNASGEAIYDAEQKAFVGIDYYTEDETVQYACDVKIRIPKSLWFDNIEISIQNEEADVDSAFHVRNGFLTQEHDDFIEELNDQLHKDVYAVIEKFRNDQKQNEYRSMWESLDINRSEFKEEGDYMVYNMETLAIGTETNIDKSICLEVKNITVDDEE